MSSSIDEASLDALITRAQEKWPRARVDRARFAEQLLQRTAGDGLALAEIETDDLYLACGCLGGDGPSIAILADLITRGATKWAAGVRVDASDLVQRVLARLLLADGETSPRLARYEGRAPLVAYLKVVTRNAAISVARGDERHDPATPAASTFFAAVGNPEHDAMRVEFREAFGRALDEAFRALDDRKRAVIAMHYADGVEVAAIAKVYRVNRVTVSRWLAEARADVFGDTRRRLRAALKLTDSEFESALRVVRSQLDIRLSTIARGAEEGDDEGSDPTTPA